MKELFTEIHEQLTKAAESQSEPVILAIDGRCAAGKTTLAENLAKTWGASLFHMDDFYLQPYQRTPERRAEPGGNVDRERFLTEVLLPLRNGETIHYRPFDCHTMGFRDVLPIHPEKIAIVEGSYACHPELREYYNLRIFLNIAPEEQLARILRRNGPECLKSFRNTWIPLEETYFKECAVPDCCDYVIDMTNVS